MATVDPLSLLAEKLIGALDSRTKANHAPYYDFATGFKHDASGNPITIGYSHGPNGTFSFPSGTDPAVFHTVVGNRGILGQLPAVPSRSTNPIYTVLTGVGSDVGSEKEEVCDDAPVAGLLQACSVTSVFGRYERATKELELNRLGQQVDRADPMDLTLIGSPIAQAGIFTQGPGNPAVPGNVLQQEMARKFWELSVSLHRLISRQIWEGNPTNNNGEGYKEMLGLDGLIRTGYVDAISGTRCYSIDSDVKNFNYHHVETEGMELVNALTYLYHTRKQLAIDTGVTPVRWVWAMRSEVFFELSAVWPCAYLSYRCDLSDATTGARVNIDARDQAQMRDDMRTQRYLPIDGDRIEVILDDGIAVETGITNNRVSSGCSSSSIYLIPMSVVGGRQVTYIEHFDYNNPDIAAALGRGILGVIEGPWITIPKQKNWCIQWQTKTEPRIIMRTPWLAGRLDNVVVCPLQYAPQPFPDNPYAFPSNGGGVTSRSGPSYYQLWNS